MQSNDQTKGGSFDESHIQHLLRLTFMLTLEIQIQAIYHLYGVP